jgi:hypothetical protein
MGVKKICNISAKKVSLPKKLLGFGIQVYMKRAINGHHHNNRYRMWSVYI